jgi:hypothetical protein
MPSSAGLAWSAALALASFVACKPAPSREQALAAMRRANPRLDSGLVSVRVWKDGPPWFSCNEVIAKLGSPVDAAVVRDQMAKWKPLVRASWLVLRDTSAGEVVEPGWCEAHLSAAGLSSAREWQPIVGDRFATG